MLTTIGANSYATDSRQTFRWSMGRKVRRLPEKPYFLL